MPYAPSSRWLNWAGNFGLLLLGIAALIATAKFVGLLPTFNVVGGPQSNIVAALAPAVSWVLVIVGWFFVSRDQNRRERRKEVRSEIERLIHEVGQIEIRAYEYLPTMADSKESRSLGLRLKSDLQRLAQSITRLSQVDEIDVKDALTTLRQAVTLGHDFDSKLRQPCDLDSAWALEVQTAANGLIDALESTFRKRHP
jgi:hypothetical protein